MLESLLFIIILLIIFRIQNRQLRFYFKNGKIQISKLFRRNLKKNVLNDII